MNCPRRILASILLVILFTLPAWVESLAQTIPDADDGTTLKQIIIFSRHGIRAPLEPSPTPPVSVDQYPIFEGVLPGHLTQHGRQAEVLLGAYYRRYLLNQGLLTGNDRTDAAHSYLRSNSLERSYATAKAFGEGLIPQAELGVHSYPFKKPDGVFDPIGAKIVKVDPERAVTEVRALFDSGKALKSAYSAEYALIRSVLLDYPLGKNPPPPAPKHVVDVTAEKILLAKSAELETGGVVNVGGLMSTVMAADPFIMQYANGFPLDQVAWGRLTMDQLTQQTRLVSLLFQIEMLSPYLNRLQSSNAAAHILRTMEQAVLNQDIRGAFGNAKSRMVVVVSSDGYVAGLAGVLDLHWQLLGYQPDFCAPGGALVFELRQSKKTKDYLVRAYYTAQTLQQLRNLTTLTLRNPPATKQLLIPGGSRSDTDLDVGFSTFKKLMTNAIDWKYVQNPSKEVPPGVLTEAYLRQEE